MDLRVGGSLAPSPLVLLSSLALTLEGIHPDLLVILLEGSEVLPRLGELTLLHTLTNIPR